MKSGKRFLVGFDLIKATPSKHHLRRGDDVEKVIRTASEKLQSDSRDIDSLYLRATSFCKKGEFSKAIEDLSYIIQQQPQYAAALYKRGTCFDKIGYIEKAIGDYSRAIEIDPKNFNALYARAACYIKLEHFELAMTDYDRAMAQDVTTLAPRKSPVRASPEKSFVSTMGTPSNNSMLSTPKSIDTPIFFLDTDSRSTSKKTLNTFETPKSVSFLLDPEPTPTPTITPLYSSKSIQEAKKQEENKIALQSQPKKEVLVETDSIESMTKKMMESVNLAKLRGETERSMSYTQATPSVKTQETKEKKPEPKPKAPETTESNPYLAQGVKEKEAGNYPQAINLLKKAINHNPQQVTAFINIAGCYEAIGEVQLAIKSYTSAVELEPNLVIAHFRRGLLYHTCEQHSDAVNDFSKAIEHAPYATDYFYHRGLCYTHIKNYQSAIKDFTKAIEANPQNFSALVQRGYSWKKLQQYQNSIKDFSQALAINPNNATALTYRSSVYTKMQSYPEALEDLNKLVESAPTYELLNARGAIYNKTGNSRMALRDFTAALKLKKNSE